MTKLLSDAEISKEVADAVLPLFMRAGDRFGLSAEGKLDASGMHNWERRCDEWLTGYHAMRRAGADENATAIRLDGIDGSSSLMQCAQRCTQLRDVALRDGYLSDHALTSLAMVMKARLRALDLHGTQGFGDHGLKALAAHATDLESLRLGGCHASDASLVAIAKYCPKLRLLELTGGPSATAIAVTAKATSLLHPECAVERPLPAGELADRMAARELLERRTQSTAKGTSPLPVRAHTDDRNSRSHNKKSVWQNVRSGLTASKPQHRHGTEVSL